MKNGSQFADIASQLCTSSLRPLHEGILGQPQDSIASQLTLFPEFSI